MTVLSDVGRGKANLHFVTKVFELNFSLSFTVIAALVHLIFCN